MAGLTIPSYNTDDTTWTETYGGSAVKGNVGGILGLLLGMDFGLLIGEAEVLVSFDNAKIDTSSYFEEAALMKGVSLHIPLLVKMDFRLGPVVLQPLAGPYFNFALGKLTTSGGTNRKESYRNPPLGLTFGALAGLNLGGGLLFIDGRFEMDLGKTEVNKSIEIWRRSAFMLNLGYQIYLGRKK
jgi:hypothetical protein